MPKSTVKTYTISRQDDEFIEVTFTADAIDAERILDAFNSRDEVYELEEVNE